MCETGLKIKIENLDDFLFQSPKKCKDPKKCNDVCMICSDEDNMTDLYLTCCQKPLCKSCFVEWYKKKIMEKNQICSSGDGQMQEKCIHCNVYFDDPIQYSVTVSSCNCRQTTQKMTDLIRVIEQLINMIQ